MKSRPLVFNGFLVLLALTLAAGCGTTEERQRKKDLSTLRIHLESDQRSEFASAISVYRTAPMRLNIEREPVLDETQVIGALLVEQPVGFGVEVKFNRQGSWILEKLSVTGKGRHLAIFSHFGPARWLAAPVIEGKNQSGQLIFTPDATREEAERFVRGLNNAARKMESKENWPFRAPVEK